MNKAGLTAHTQEATLPLRGGRGFAPPPPPAEPQASAWAKPLQYLLEGPAWKWLRPAIDFTGVSIAVALSFAITPAEHLDRLPTLALPLLVVVVCALRGFYRQRMRMLALDGIVPTIGAVSIAAMATAMLDYYTYNRVMGGGALVRLWALSVIGVGGGRALVAVVQRWARSRRLVSKPTLIVGAGVVGSQVARRLATAPEYGMVPIGFLDDDPLPSGDLDEPRLPLLGHPDQLADVARRTGAEQIVFAFSSCSDRRLLPLVREAEELGLGMSIVPRMYESLNGQMAYDVLGGMPLLSLHGSGAQGPAYRIKSALDRSIAALLLTLLGPVLLALALAVKLSSRGPVLFRQQRVGIDGREFGLYKFRSMRLDPEFEPARAALAAAAGTAPALARDTAPGGVEGDDRRTVVGRLLRRTSLDELPQLFNVLRGEMSLIGPRPERPEFVEMFAREVGRYEDRHAVKPGITGWAQVHGLRGQTSLRDRVEWDNYYIRHWSLGLDARILLMTFTAMFVVPE